MSTEHDRPQPPRSATGTSGSTGAPSPAAAATSQLPAPGDLVAEPGHGQVVAALVAGRGRGRLHRLARRLPGRRVRRRSTTATATSSRSRTPGTPTASSSPAVATPGGCRPSRRSAWRPVRPARSSPAPPLTEVVEPVTVSSTRGHARSRSSGSGRWSAPSGCPSSGSRATRTATPSARTIDTAYRLAHDEIGARRVRAHAIFHDDVHVLTWPEGGEPAFDFSGVDDLVDQVMATGLRPVLELGFMPRDLATDVDARPASSTAASSRRPKDW